jgi:hypothetical protein
MSCVVFELTILASERAKTVHALDRSATVTGDCCNYCAKIRCQDTTSEGLEELACASDLWSV